MEEDTKNTKKKNNKFMNFLYKNSIPAYTAIGISVFLLTAMITAQITTMSKSEEILKGKREGERESSLTNRSFFLSSLLPYTSLL